MATPLTMQQLQRLASMLVAPGPSGNMASGAMPAWAQNGINTNRVMAPSPRPRGAPGAVGENAINQNPPVPNPQLPTAPPPVTNASFQAPAGAVGENAINQNPPVPNPPLPPPVPPVTNASFSPMGGTGAPPPPPMLGAGPGTSPMGATPPPMAPNVANMPAPVGSDPSMVDPGIRQTIINAMKAKNMLPPAWAQNFGSLADQQGG